MRALIDTCVIIDALQNREPFAEDAKKLFLMLANENFEGYVSAKSITDIYYITHRLTHSNEQTRKILKNLLGLFDILDTTAIDCRKALSSNIVDYEDAVMCETAERSEVDCIVTRNQKDYANSKITIYSPNQFTSKIENIIK